MAFELLKFKILTSHLKKGHYDVNDAINLSHILITQPVKRPEFIEQILSALQQGWQSGNFTGYNSFAYYLILSDLSLYSHQDDKLLDMFQIRITHEQNDGDSLWHGYDELYKILQHNPQWADKIFNIFKQALQLNNNDWHSLYGAYWALDKIFSTYPQHKEQVLETLKEALLSKKKIRNNFKEGFSVLKRICRNDTEFIESILDLIKSDKNNPSLLEYAYTILGKMVNDQPELAEKILNTVIQGKDSVYQLYAYRACMKHLPLEETIAKYPEIIEDLKFVHKARFASDEEFDYALTCFDKEYLTNSMIFRAQQHTMNILLSTAAEEYGFLKDVAEKFRKPDALDGIKDFLKNNNDWLIPASFKSAAIFKDRFPSYLKQILNHNQKNPRNSLSIHDAVYWLPKPMDEKSNAHFAEFIQKNLFYQNAKHQMVHRPLNELETIAQNWKKVEKELKKRGETADIKQFKYADVLSVCASVKYDNPQNEQFAAEAAKHYVPEYRYYEYEDIYLAGLKVPEPFDSTKEFKIGKYKGRFLPRDDVRTGFFGDYTNCCQHFGGVGDSCAVSTVKHPFSQLFVIEDEKGKIIAGSWAWENTENKYREVCFDNIEALGELQKRPEINEIYEQVGSYLANKENCRRVTIGLGCQDANVSKYKKTEAIALPKLYGKDGTNSYSDARSQVLLAQNKNAEPLDHTKESQRYIRNVCYLDKKALQSVTEQCFSKSDNKPFKSDHLDGFVIEDREKGVVGYILYDKEEKEIYDMAVLSEYCTDKNASSRKLFAEMMRVVKEDGGQWHAELKDKETLRYMESMVELGAIKMEKNDVDNETRNTSKAIQLTIEPVRDEVRQAQQRVSDKVQMKHTDVLTEPTEIPSVIVSQHNNGRDGR